MGEGISPAADSHMCKSGSMTTALWEWGVSGWGGVGGVDQWACGP